MGLGSDSTLSGAGDTAAVGSAGSGGQTPLLMLGTGTAVVGSIAFGSVASGGEASLLTMGRGPAAELGFRTGMGRGRSTPTPEPTRGEEADADAAGTGKYGGNIDPLATFDGNKPTANKPTTDRGGDTATASVTCEGDDNGNSPRSGVIVPTPAPAAATETGADPAVRVGSVRSTAGICVFGPSTAGTSMSVALANSCGSGTCDGDGTAGTDCARGGDGAATAGTIGCAVSDMNTGADGSVCVSDGFNADDAMAAAAATCRRSVGDDAGRALCVDGMRFCVSVCAAGVQFDTVGTAYSPCSTMSKGTLSDGAATPGGQSFETVIWGVHGNGASCTPPANLAAAWRAASPSDSNLSTNSFVFGKLTSLIAPAFMTIDS